MGEHEHMMRCIILGLSIRTRMTHRTILVPDSPLESQQLNLRYSDSKQEHCYDYVKYSDVL